jgi:hypothetical protein
MYIEQALEEAKKVRAIGKKIRIKQLDEGFEAKKMIVFEYGYEFEVANLLALTKEDLSKEVKERWGLSIPPINGF